jgi:hypothetical protein
LVRQWKRKTENQPYKLQQRSGETNMTNKYKRHGLSIGIERIDDTFFLSLKAIGKLTHQDYGTITPMIDSALEGVTSPKLNVYIDGTELDGWEARAAWDDFKLGLKHGGEMEKVAIVGNKRWQELSAKLGSWFVGGEIQFFEESDAALAWLQA